METSLDGVREDTSKMRPWLQRRAPGNKMEYVIAGNDRSRSDKKAEHYVWDVLAERLKEDGPGATSVLYELAVLKNRRYAHSPND